MKDEQIPEPVFPLTGAMTTSHPLRAPRLRSLFPDPATFEARFHPGAWSAGRAPSLRARSAALAGVPPAILAH